MRSKCVIILSSKSSGSSALQNVLTSHPHVRHVDWTPHFENETLYWLKAASMLGLPGLPMPNGKVPMPAWQARSELEEFLCRNLGGFPSHDKAGLPQADRELVFEGWSRLCRHYAPVFVEKSPHHLHQWSALELMVEAMERDPEVDYLFVGLARNPMSTLYSMWRRWKAVPEVHQHLWAGAYRNLLRLRERLGTRLIQIRYEDMVRDPDALAPVRSFLGVADASASEALHSRSVQKWRSDAWFGFVLDPEVQRVAEEFGYGAKELENRKVPGWQLYRRACGLQHRCSRLVQRVRRKLSGRVRPA